MLQQIISLVQNKHVHIATHWDCDGVTSGALLYHILKNHARKITTKSKGDVFQVLEKDCPAEADIIICSDIQPSHELDPNKVIYIDHHPLEQTDQYLLSIHDIEIQSCSLLIWRDIISETNNPYYIFLTLLGYFGDNGSPDEIPIELQTKANEHFPELMQKKVSSTGNEYTVLMMYVSMFNTGKRIHWNGEVPLALLKTVTSHVDIIMKRHPLVDELERYKIILRGYYNQTYDFTETDTLTYSIIECDKNIQGVICSRKMTDKPVIVLNRFNGQIIASMRVPDELDFDAGAFLSKSKELIPDVVGGGHEKAGGITFDVSYLDQFLAYLEGKTVVPSPQV